MSYCKLLNAMRNDKIENSSKEKINDLMYAYKKQTKHKQIRQITTNDNP